MRNIHACARKRMNTHAHFTFSWLTLRLFKNDRRALTQSLCTIHWQEDNLLMHLIQCKVTCRLRSHSPHRHGSHRNFWSNMHTTLLLDSRATAHVAGRPRVHTLTT